MKSAPLSEGILRFQAHWRIQKKMEVPNVIMKFQLIIERRTTDNKSLSNTKISKFPLGKICWMYSNKTPNKGKYKRFNSDND